MVLTEVVSFPPLYGNVSNGKTKVWYARVLTNSNGHGISEIRHGQKDGKLQTAERIIQVGKNVGKKNETTPIEQCISEVNRKWTDKKEKEGYTEEENKGQQIPSTTSTIYPMLAQKYESKKPKKNGIVFPCFVQPKLDGLRCVVYKNSLGNLVTQSRTGGIFETMGHIISELQPLFNKYPCLILDGELYTTEIPFENLAGLIKKKYTTAEDMKSIQQIEYHVYDLIHAEAPDMQFSDRIVLLDAIIKDNKYKNIKFVKTCAANSDAEFYEKFQEFIAEGYEGAMLRNSLGVYKQNTRSSDLQKYKEFHEEEYEIVDYTQGEGRDAGTVIWVCQTVNGSTFNVRPRGTIEYRSDLYKNGKKYIGSLLTVIFQELTGLGIPRFPVGKCIRDGF